MSKDTKEKSVRKKGQKVKPSKKGPKPGFVRTELGPNHATTKLRLKRGESESEAITRLTALGWDIKTAPKTLGEDKGSKFFAYVGDGLKEPEPPAKVKEPKTKNNPVKPQPLEESQDVATEPPSQVREENSPVDLDESDVKAENEKLKAFIADLMKDR